jgi:hypothetical protein
VVFPTLGRPTIPTPRVIGHLLVFERAKSRDPEF